MQSECDSLLSQNTKWLQTKFSAMVYLTANLGCSDSDIVRKQTITLIIAVVLLHAVIKIIADL